MSRAKRQRGGSMVESALVFMVCGVLFAGIMQLGVIGFAINSVTFAARRAARFAGTRGSSSGHPASIADIQNTARIYASPLKADNISVLVQWIPNNSPGGTAQVKVTYHMAPLLMPDLTLESTARERIYQ